MLLTVRKRQNTLQHSKNPRCFYILHTSRHFHHCSPPPEILGSIKKGDKTLKRFRTDSIETLHFGNDIGDTKKNVMAIDIGGVRM